ncbi:NAD(P)-binding protein [Pleomassaria siparia CBS 279.74]|uniref:NAD(P)-binding protein n=1 Tax=Pleomassaria siparia CBS 279.74 TaxID=1314801 RepID=A0A6G1JXT9_9PLEO|nr:NAD(P)-binding protein [Pleomassaria siparia CBS 279.74]
MGPYITSHIDRQGAGDSRPTALQIIKDQELEGKLAGKTIVLTGARTGIGLETARALSSTGANLILLVRDVEKASTTLGDILEPGRVSLVDMDNASFASVRTAAATILTQTNNRINILIANAGIMGIQERTLTEDGYEMHFATNHLGHFLLFQLLKDALLTASTPSFHSRVVVVSSSSQRARGLNASDNYNFEKGGYKYELAYANSKLANVYMANEIERRYASKGLHATSVHPGAIWTDLPRHLGREFIDNIMGNEKIAKWFKNAEQGAATTVVASVGKEWEGTGGKYLEDCEEAKRGADDGAVFGVGYVKHTYDPEAELRLWKDSLKIVEMDDDTE